MSDVLAKICEEKRDHVSIRRKVVPLADIRSMAANAPKTRGFANALTFKAKSGQYALIAEIKKASPSKGLIRDHFDPEALAKAYEKGGATCLSVLTDEPYFQGKDQYLSTVRNACSLPILRKDFMLEPYQIYESRALGADCVLLIMAALDDGRAAELEALAMDLTMDVLVEVHDATELSRALKLKSPLIGINNRNLKTLEVNLATTEALAGLLPSDRVLVAESGLYAPEDLARMEKVGAMRFLIGESLMRQDDVEAATRAILTRSKG